MKFLLINYTNPDPKCEEVPYLWLTLHSYFKRNSKNPSQWQWLDPIYSSVAESEQNLVDKIVKQEPDVLGISCYMWNDKLTFYVAEQVKLKLPNIKIIAGGPALYYERDISWFKKKWFIDAVCQYDGYGEVFITDYLDGVLLEDIPFAVYPSTSRSRWNKSSAVFNKRNFNYPLPYHDNKEYLNRFPKGRVKVLLDTSRGCPYACTFCEWGGGTSTKVVFKPSEDLHKELDTIFNILRPEHIDIINANFGITKDDVEMTRKLARLNSIFKCVKYVNVYGPTKNRKENLKEIYDILLTNNMLDDIKLSIQHTNQTILDNIKRTDTPLSEQIDMFGELCHKHNTPLKVEAMLGLPGETLDNFYQLIDDMTKSPLLDPMFHEWMMLPSAPAADTNYVTSMEILTKKIAYAGEDFNRNIIPRNEYTLVTEQTGLRELLNDHKWLEPYDIVVGTYSYGIEEWAEMEAFKYYFTFLSKQRIITPIISRLRQRGVSISEFSRSLTAFLMEFDVVRRSIESLKENIHKEVADIYYADLAPSLPYVSHYSVIKFLILLSPEAFFDKLSQFLTNKYGYDEHIKLICDRFSDNVMTPFKSTKDPKEAVSQALSMCRNWRTSVFLEDFRLEDK